MSRYESMQELIGETPLVRLNHLDLPDGVQLYAKLELWNPSGSVKDRTGKYMIEDAERKELLLPGGTIVEATAGNTGLGIAFAALNKGYKIIFVVPTKFSQEKQTLMRALGAEIINTPREGGMLGAAQKAEEMLVQWEAGDKDVRALWQTMNDWTLNGVQETYKRTGVSFDKLYFESDTYLKGKDEIQRGLDMGIFFKAADGSTRVDVTEAVGKGKDGEDHEKVLLRSDGTSVYITQDIGTAISRHKDWPFNQMVYVVASEQNFHFKVLFYILKKLGFDWAQKLFHLSYGLVNLPSGRMKSREGTVVDADDLLDSLHADALKEIKEKGRDKELDDPDAVAEKVALAAVHYYMLQATPIKDMLFNPEESLSFNGNTGPYLQYMGARISSILAKAKESGVLPDSSEAACALLTSGDEWELVKQLGSFPDTVAKAAANLDPSLVAAFLYDTAKLFSKFYQNCSIINAESKELAAARLFLAQSTLDVMKEAMDLVLVPFLEKM